jgi:hypothetical protein
MNRLSGTIHAEVGEDKAKRKLGFFSFNNSKIAPCYQTPFVQQSVRSNEKFLKKLTP